jgi:hypothetical protein
MVQRGVREGYVGLSASLAFCLCVVEHCDQFLLSILINVANAGALLGVELVGWGGGGGGKGERRKKQGGEGERKLQRNKKWGKS